MPLTIPTGTSFLEFYQTNNLESNTQCKQGFCGSCRVRYSGLVEHINDPIAYLDEGEALVCCAIAKTDVKIYRPGEIPCKI